MDETITAGDVGAGCGVPVQTGPVPVEAPTPMDRRRFLSRTVVSLFGLAAAGAFAEVLGEEHSSAATLPKQPGTPAGPATPARHQWCMVIDLRVCNGCKECTAACQKAHYLHEDQTWIDVVSMRSADGEDYYMPRPCMMCEDPPCVPVCPVGANFRTAEGLTLVDQSRCVGTRICMNSCPYQARYFNWGDAVPAPRQPFPQEPTWPVPQVKGTVGKCVYCAAMLPSGKVPECVSNCPMGVIYLGDMVSDVAVNGLGQVVRLSEFLSQNNAVKFKESYGTHPRVFYVPGRGQNLDTDE
jgi:molybdopterin-containing oxidoreductase family iron-sulfur binding subunit